MSKNINYQEVPIKIKPQFNGYSDYSEIIFFLPGEILPEIKCKNYFISNNGKVTTNYKCIHFIINGKELNEEEIQKISVEDINNESFLLYKSNQEIFNMYNHIKVVLNHPINRNSFNSPRLFLTRVIKTTQEIKYL